MIDITEEVLQNITTYVSLAILAAGSLIMFFISLQKKYFEKENNALTTKTARMFFLIITATCIILAATRYYKINLVLILQKMISFLISIKNWIIIIVILAITYKIIKKIRKRIQKKNEQFLEELERIGDKEVKEVWEAEEKICKIEALAEEKNKLAQKHQDEIKNAIQKAENRIKQIQQKEKQKEEDERIQQKEKEEKQKKIQKLYLQYREQGNDETMPEWAIEYDSDIIKKAQEQHHEHKLEQQQKRRDEESDKYETNQIAKFILKNKAYPSDYPYLKEKTRQKYQYAMQLYKKGQLKAEEPPNNEIKEQKYHKEEIKESKDKELFKENFYHANSLSEEQKELLLKNGYRRKPFITLHGEPGNNLIIKHDSTNESDYHFCMKHIFREIDFPSSDVEQGDGEFRADVAFFYDEGQIAVEIETGKNKEEQIQRKVKWLNKNYDYWVFVCSRENKKKYKKYVDNKKSFCLTLHEASQKVDELIEELTIHPI